MDSKNHSNYPKQYLEQIENGEVVVSRKIRIAYEYFVNHLENDDSKWEYRDDLALHVIDFIENYCVTSKGQAKPLILEMFQKAAISLMFGWVEKGTAIRKHKISHFIVARKNGKSTLASAIALYLLFADGEHGPEIYSVATKQDQAKIIWEESGKMMRKSPYLSQLGRSLHSDILSDINDGSFRALGRDSKTLDGLNPSGALMDEIEAWTDMNMYNVIVDGTAARDNWFILLTSTAGPVRESVWDNLYRDGEFQINAYAQGKEIDERVLFLIYELDKKEEWQDAAMWQKANPALGTIKKADDLKRKVENAKRNPRLVNNLVMKDFNIPETDESAWLNLEDIINETELVWDEEKKKFLVTDLIQSRDKVDRQSRHIKPRYGIGGFDLSETTDLTCASVMFKVEGDPRIYMIQMYWIPEELIEIREEEDNVPYRAWEREGYLRTTPGNRIDYKEVAAWFIEVQEKLDIYLIHIGYDGWSASYLVDEMASYFGKNAMEEVRQGAKTLSAPMKLLESDLKSKRLVYGRNPIFEWCVTNVKVKEDTNGNIQPTKEKGKNVRIDGFAAALDAYVALERNKDNYTRMIGG